MMGSGGLLFYRGGELANRRTAFSLAFTEWKTANNGAKLTEEGLQEIVIRTNDLTLNMTKSARANWQKGALSIPTQFFGITARTLESLFGANENLTKAERMRVLAGQVALYGTAGIPLANMGLQYLADGLGITQEDIDNNPVAVKTINDGFWGFVTLGILGVDAEVSQRGSLLRGMTDFVDNWMFSEATVATKLLGAFGTTGTRFWDELTKQLRPLSFGAYPVDIIDAVAIPTKPFLSTIATWRNGEKALFMQLMDKILTKNQDALTEDTYTIRESIMTAIGFRLSDETKAYSLEEMTQHTEGFRSKVANMIVEMMHDSVIKSEAGLWSDKKQNNLEQNYAAIYSGLDGGDSAAVRKLVQRKLIGDSKEAKAINRYKRTVVERSADSIPAIQAMLGGKFQTVDNPEEE